MIDFMEPKIVELLLEQLKTVSSTDNPTDQNICSAILILTQLSFVNKIANSDVIFNQILDILRSTEDAFRNEIIKFLPVRNCVLGDFDGRTNSDFILGNIGH